MVKDFYKTTDCPFIARDRVKDDVTGAEGTVTAVQDETVYVVLDSGERFYRTWFHNLDTVMKKSGGGLTRIERPAE